jgi:hypothetical protein
MAHHANGLTWDEARRIATGIATAGVDGDAVERSRGATSESPSAKEGTRASARKGHYTYAIPLPTPAKPTAYQCGGRQKSAYVGRVLTSGPRTLIEPSLWRRTTKTDRLIRSPRRREANGVFISHAGRSADGQSATVMIRTDRVPPLSLPNVARNVIAHELGHAIGLGHNSDPTMLMCGRPAPCRPDVFASSMPRYFPLSSGDQANLLAMYPGSWKNR